jgi:hypothetical protein
MRKLKTYANSPPIVRDLDRFLALADLVIFLTPGQLHYAWTVSDQNRAHLDERVRPDESRYRRYSSGT